MRFYLVVRLYEDADNFPTLLYAGNCAIFKLFDEFEANLNCNLYGEPFGALKKKFSEYQM